MTWKGQTRVDDTSSYSMGWLDVRANSVRWLNHSGSADSFKTDMNLLPDHGLGFLVFTNSESGSALLWTLRTYLLDKLSSKTSNAFGPASAAFRQQNEARDQLRSSIKSFTVKRAEVEPHLGAYEKAWQVVYEDDRLWLTRTSGYKLALLLKDNGYLIGSSNHLSGFGMLVNFVKNDQGKPAMTITNEGQIIDTLALMS